MGRDAGCASEAGGGKHFQNLALPLTRHSHATSTFNSCPLVSNN